MQLTSRTAKYSTKKEKVTIERSVDSVEVDLDFTQMYNCFMLLSFNISSASSFHILFFLLQQMNKDNIVLINGTMVTKFQEMCRQIGKKPISEQSFYKCTKDLKEAGVMEKLNKGQYIMNIYGMWKGDKAKRIEYLISENKDGQKMFKNPLHLLLPEGKELKEYTETGKELPAVKEDPEYYYSYQEPEE